MRPRRSDQTSGDEKRLIRYSQIYALASLEYAFLRLEGVDPADYLIALSVWTANIRHLIFDAALLEKYSFGVAAVPMAAERAVSRSAISRFLNIPFETVRRRSALLISRGILAERPEGLVTVAMDAAFSGGFWQIELNNARAFAALHGRIVKDKTGAAAPGWIARCGLDGEPDAGWVRAVTKLSGDYMTLMMSELLRVLKLSIGDMLIFIAVSRDNVAHLFTHREHRSNNPVVADEMRRGTTRKAVARSLVMPAETVRRRAAGLVDRGLLVERDDGLIVPAEVYWALYDGQFSRLNTRAAKRAFSTLQQLEAHRRQAQERRATS